jgi:flagellar basal body-associated protein FliL
MLRSISGGNGVSETQDMSRLQPETVDTSIDTSEISINFAPLIEDDTEDFELPLRSAARPPRRRRWIIPLIIILVIFLAGGGIFAYMQYTRPAVVQYTQAAATVGNIAQTVSSTGQVQPGATYNLNFTASGQIQTIYVHAGQQVKQGQVLAKLNAPSLQDAVNQAQQAVNNAKQPIMMPSTTGLPRLLSITTTVNYSPLRIS